MDLTFDGRRSDRRLHLGAAIALTVIVLIGFGRTYYFKMLTGAPPLPSALVHIHGLVMSAWVAFFIAQVCLIRTAHTKTHMKLGLVGIALAGAVLVVGFFTAAAAAKNGSPSTPPGFSHIAFSIVPFVDLVVFAGLFGAAICRRSCPPDHKRLMLLTSVGLLPPALGRIPIPALQSLGPLLFFGVPTVLAIGLVVYDTRHTKKLNRAFLVGAAGLIVSYPVRMALANTDAWIGFATWITTWAA